MVYISIGLGKIGLSFVRMEPASRLFALTIPARVDTKLSKIKTLRLAIAYISYLEELLRSERPCEIQEGCGFEGSDEEDFCDDNKPDCGLRNRTRTGWPHQVWAAEFSPSADKAIAAKGTARLERC
ncbi:heart- and neural crest derivatives-expressed protein 1-like isoform X3 [Varroa destructor]|nr:heart- and neural crest derivatives-expressed protein 1-like isoform X3 [Varroa destructor]